MTVRRVVLYEPGHFHAALLFRTPNPRLARDIHVYATPGPERDAFMVLVESFNQRPEQPTGWNLHLHGGEDLLERLIADGHGDVAVLAGRNNTKLALIARLTRAGLHVLADKPWLTDSSQLQYLAEATAGPQLAMDIMTIRHEILARLCHQVIASPELFGTFVTQDADEPAIAIGSVHHLYKTVNGRPLQRPPWYYDTAVQGDGLVDIQSHMAEQAQWWVLGDAVGNSERDIVLDAARCWTTPVPLQVFRDSTGLSQYPDALQAAVQDGVLAYACNGEIHYRLRGVSIQQTAEWRLQEPAGGSDLHRVTLRGSRCQVHVRQGPKTGYQAEVHLAPVAGIDLEPMLRAHVAGWQEHFPGLAWVSSDLGFRLVTPPALDRGHESHFPLVLDTFLDYLDRGSWPQALPARIRMRYTLLAQARQLAM